jgi:hypothetical protein
MTSFSVLYDHVKDVATRADQSEKLLQSGTRRAHEAKVAAAAAQNKAPKDKGTFLGKDGTRAGWHPVLNVDTSAGIATILPHQSHRIIHQSSSISTIINHPTLYLSLYTVMAISSHVALNKVSAGGIGELDAYITKALVEARNVDSDKEGDEDYDGDEWTIITDHMPSTSKTVNQNTKPLQGEEKMEATRLSGGTTKT